MSAKTTDREIGVPLDDVIEAARILVQHFDRAELAAAIDRVSEEQGRAIDALTEHALDEYRAGRTRNLRELAEAAGVELDAPEPPHDE